jgi:membrane protease YdiL (CAAX protease family)
MPSLLLTTLAKAALPAAAIAGMLFAAKRKKLSLADDLGFKPPAMGIAALCLLGWICLITVEEYFTGSIADVQAKRWPDYSAAITALRILAIGIIGPIAEELAFRGLLMAWLRRIRVGAVWAILIAAALWSIIHLQYAPVVLLIIFIDGIALGVARHVSGSLYVPIVMHISGNLFSIYQSLA